MTPTSAIARCLAAGLRVLSAEAVGRQVCVTVAKVPQSADGLKTLLERIGAGSMTVSMSGAHVRLWFMGEA